MDTKKCLFLLLLMSFTTLLISCDEDIPSTFELNREFDLALKENALLAQEALKVEFLELISDSRCPEDVTCFWEGESTVKLLIEGSDSIQFSLSTHPDYNDNIKIYKSYKITLIDILPYPNTSKKYDPSDYYVKVLVEKV